MGTRQCVFVVLHLVFLSFGYFNKECNLQSAQVCLLGAEYVYLVRSMSTWCGVCLLGAEYVYWVRSMSTGCGVCLLGAEYVYWVRSMSTGCGVCPHVFCVDTTT